MKRNPDTQLKNGAQNNLAEYIASRRDLDNAGPREIETALKTGWEADGRRPLLHGLSCGTEGYPTPPRQVQRDPA